MGLFQRDHPPRPTWGDAGHVRIALLAFVQTDHRAMAPPPPNPEARHGRAVATALRRAAGGPALAADEVQRRAERDRNLARWLAGAAAGRASDFEAFYDATVGHARALARRIVQGADLEDALADAYLDAWKRTAQFDPARGSPVSWLLTIVHSRAHDLLRRRGRLDPLPEGADDDIADEAPDPSERLWQRQSQGRLARALSELSAPERWVLGLAYFADMPHSAIASTTGMPLGTVKSLILRAQGKLRAQLSPTS